MPKSSYSVKPSYASSTFFIVTETADKVVHSYAALTDDFGNLTRVDYGQLAVSVSNNNH